MFLEGATWTDMASLECVACRGERLARSRVAFSDQDPRFQRPPFEAAPYIHPNNLPKYYAQQQRAIVFAKQRQRCVNWIVAHDKPLHQDDQALSDEVLNKKRLRWLGYHDMKTGGIMGVLPLVRGLPMRLSDTVNRGLKLYRNRECTLDGWTLHPDEASEADAGERVLQHQPLCLYLKFDGATWRVEDLEPGVYPLQPSHKDWFVNESTKVKAKRTGFQAVPYFSGTSFMFQGATKDAVIADCLEVAHVSRQSDALSAYVANSRVKTKEGILIMQPFSPGLFAHGPPPGPHILMRLLRGDIETDGVDAEFDRMRQEARDRSAEKDLMKMHWQCQACFLEGRADYMKPMLDFNVRCAADFVNKLLPQGAWTRCSRCIRKLRQEAIEVAKAARTHVCKACGKDKLRAEFWPEDWKIKQQGIACKTCEARPPQDRPSAVGSLSQPLRLMNEIASMAVHRCRACGLDRRRAEFWDTDWGNREQGSACKIAPAHSI